MIQTINPPALAPSPFYSHGVATDSSRLVTDPADLPGFLTAASEGLRPDPPATTLLIVAGLADPALRVEIEAVAAG